MIQIKKEANIKSFIVATLLSLCLTPQVFAQTGNLAKTDKIDKKELINQNEKSLTDIKSIITSYIDYDLANRDRKSLGEEIFRKELLNKLNDIKVEIANLNQQVSILTQLNSLSNKLMLGKKEEKSEDPVVA